MLYASCDRTDYFPSADWSLCNMFLRLCRPVWVPLLHQQWHGYEVHLAGRGRRKSWPRPRGRTWFPFPFCQLSEHPSNRRWDQPWTEQNLLLMKQFYNFYSAIWFLFPPVSLTVWPYLAPRRDLCVVEVTRSACSKGEGMALAATRPLIWAMSASR